MKTPKKIAVALEYDGSNAPHVTAKGMGDIAEQILQLAKQYNIPIQTDKELIKVLAQVKLGDEIPERLYMAVAEIIAFAYLLKGKFPKNFKET